MKWIPLQRYKLIKHERSYSDCITVFMHSTCVCFYIFCTSTDDNCTVYVIITNNYYTAIWKSDNSNKEDKTYRTNLSHGQKPVGRNAFSSNNVVAWMDQLEDDLWYIYANIYHQQLCASRIQIWFMINWFS